MKEFYDIENGNLLGNETGAIDLIDNLISCEIPEDEVMKEYVTKLQTHKHTQSCMKYDGNCRYGFARFPNEKCTIIAGPPPDDMSKEKITENQTILKKTRKILETSIYILE